MKNTTTMNRSCSQYLKRKRSQPCRSIVNTENALPFLSEMDKQVELSRQIHHHSTLLPCRPFRNHKLSMKSLLIIHILILVAFDISRKTIVCAQSTHLYAGKRNEPPLCEVYNEFRPPLLHNTGSYGNMFEVRAKQYPVTIVQISFLTDMTKELNFHVWTKDGPYSDHENDESSWTKIATGKTIGLGVKQPTPIDEKYFSSVLIEPRSTQSFVVMLDSPDIRYNFGTIEGSVDMEHDDIDLLEGKSIALFPPFIEAEKKFFSPRTFAGSIKYWVNKPCEHPSTSPSAAPSHPPSKGPSLNPTMLTSEKPTMMLSLEPTRNVIITPIEYSYIFEIEESEIEKISAELKDLTATILNKFLEDKSYGVEELLRGDVAFTGVTTIARLDSSEYQCEVSNPKNMCVALQCTAEISHNTDVSGGEVRYIFLPFSGMIYSELTFVKLQYVGPKAVETRETIQLNGVNYNIFEDESQIAYLEKAVKDFFAEVQDQASIARVKIINKTKLVDTGVDYQFRRNLANSATPSRARSHMSEDLSSVDITLSITGEYQPPPELNLGHVFQESFKNEGNNFVEKLKKGENENFQQVTEIVVKDDATTTDAESEENYNNMAESSQKTKKGEKEMPQSKVPTGAIVGVISGVCIVSIVIVVLKKKDDSTQEPHFTPSTYQ